MIDAYSWPTPNGHKVHIMLEETGLPYKVHAVNIRQGDQFKPEFLKLNPNHRIPAIVDSEGPGGKPLSVFESGAILLYLASKTGKFMPGDQHAYWNCVQWLMWQMGGVGPMFGQATHFRSYSKEKLTYPVERYTNEANRLTRILDNRLGETRYVAGADYTIADIAVFPWMRGSERRGVNVADYGNVKRWFDEINSRPAVQRGVQVLHEVQAAAQAPHDDKSWEVMFGKVQFQKH